MLISLYQRFENLLSLQRSDLSFQTHYVMVDCNGSVNETMVFLTKSKKR